MARKTNHLGETKDLPELAFEPCPNFAHRSAVFSLRSASKLSVSVFPPPAAHEYETCEVEAQSAFRDRLMGWGRGVHGIRPQGHWPAQTKMCLLWKTWRKRETCTYTCNEDTTAVIETTTAARRNARIILRVGVRKSRPDSSKEKAKKKHREAAKLPRNQVYSN